MAANKTASKAAHFEISSGTAYTLNLTGAGKYVDIVPHSHGSHHDVYFAVAASEAGLPTVSVEGDDMYLAHKDERIRIPVPANTWIRFIAGSAMDVSVMKVNTIF